MLFASNGSDYFCFIQALNVINVALEVNRESIIVAPLLLLAELDAAERDFVVAIVDSEDELVAEDYVTIRLQDGGFVLVAHGRTTEAIDWTVSRASLQDIIAHPRRYIEHPDQLDLDWLRRRVGQVASEAEQRST